MLTPEQLADLRAKAEAATPGPWENVNRHVQYKHQDDWGYVCYSEEAENNGPPPGIWKEEDAAFIAAANPYTILYLIRSIGELNADCTNLDLELDRRALEISDIAERLGIPGEYKKMTTCFMILNKLDDILWKRSLGSRRIRFKLSRCQKIKMIKIRFKQLEKETTWLAKQCSDNIDHAGIEKWREAARKAIKGS